MKARSLPPHKWQWIEWILGFSVLGGFIYMAWLTKKLGYFPQPFFYDTDDTWRDWFSTAIWAHEDGAYDSWLTLYPPLSFLFLKIAGLPSCYVYAPMATVRECDWLGVVVMHAIYVINIVLTALCFIKIDKRTALSRSFAVTAGMPMLFGLERGNLILLCFTFVVLGFGPLLKSARWRWLCIGVAVNFKVYLISGIVPHLLRRRWLWVEGAILATLGVYLISYCLYGDGTPMQLYRNITGWSSSSRPNDVLAIWYPNTYIPLHYVLTESDAPINMVLSSKIISLAIHVMEISTRVAQASILLAAAATWIRPEVVPPFRLTLFGVALAMITSETSNYTGPIMFLFVFMERWEGWMRPLAIIACYLLCIPGDIMIGPSAPVYSFSFISGHYVNAEYGISLGIVGRPLVFMLPAFFLSLLTIHDVWKDIRYQGWKRRWRFRNDLPLLPGVARPSSPTAVQREISA